MAGTGALVLMLSAFVVNTHWHPGAREWDAELTESFVTSDHPIEKSHRAVTAGQAGSQRR